MTYSYDRTASDKQAYTVPYSAVEAVQAIKEASVHALRSANSNRWRITLLGMESIVERMGDLLVDLGSPESQDRAELFVREIRKVRMTKLHGQPEEAPVEGP